MKYSEIDCKIGDFVPEPAGLSSRREEITMKLELQYSSRTTPLFVFVKQLSILGPAWRG